MKLRALLCVPFVVTSMMSFPQEDEKEKARFEKTMSALDLRRGDLESGIDPACFKNKSYEVCFEGYSYPELVLEAEVDLEHEAAWGALLGFYPGTTKDCRHIGRNYVGLSRFEGNESEYFTFVLTEDDSQGRIGKDFIAVVSFTFDWVAKDDYGNDREGWRNSQCHRGFKWKDRGKAHDWEVEWMGPVDCSCAPFDYFP